VHRGGRVRVGAQVARPPAPPRCARAGSAARPARPLDLIFWCAAVRVRGAPGTMTLRENGREARWGLAAPASSCPWQAGAARPQRAPGLRPSCRSGPARELNPRARGGLRSAAPMTLWFCDHAGSNTSPHTHPGPVWTPHLQRPARRWAAAARSPCPRGGVSSLPAPLAPTKSLICLLNILFGLVQRVRPCADDLDSIVHPKRVSCAAWWAWFVVAVQVR